jgi:hypothetical protein
MIDALLLSLLGSSFVGSSIMNSRGAEFLWRASEGPVVDAESSLGSSPLLNGILPLPGAVSSSAIEARPTSADAFSCISDRPAEDDIVPPPPGASKSAGGGGGGAGSAGGA